MLYMNFKQVLEKIDAKRLSLDDSTEENARDFFALKVRAAKEKLALLDQSFVDETSAKTYLIKNLEGRFTAITNLMGNVEGVGHILSEL